MSCAVALDQWANPIQDLGGYNGPVIYSHSVRAKMNNKARGANHSVPVDGLLVSHRIIAPNYLTQSFLQIETSDSDREDVKIVVQKNSRTSFFKRSNIAGRKAVNGSAGQDQIFVPHGRKAVNGSANQNPPNSFLKSELNNMHGERRGIRFIQHNTNDTTTGEKSEYMPSGLAFSMDLHHRNDRNASYQDSKNNIGMERGPMRKEPDKQSSGNGQDRPQDCLLLHLHSDGATKTPIIDY